MIYITYPDINRVDMTFTISYTVFRDDLASFGRHVDSILDVEIVELSSTEVMSRQVCRRSYPGVPLKVSSAKARGFR